MRNDKVRWRALLVLLASLALVVGVAACGDDDDGSDDGGGGGGSTEQIQSNPDNGKVAITVGSKNFTEQLVLGEIYAQALEAAGYKVEKKLDLGSELIAKKALETGEISGYPEYVSTALTSFFGVEPGQVPSNPQQGAAQARAEFEKEGLTSFAPTPFASANAVGTLKETADKLGLTKVSDLKGKSQQLTLYGSPECRQRVDCLVGLEGPYGLTFKEFKPVDIGLRYSVLDKGQADLSILFTTDAQLAAEADKYVILEDDKQVFPAGNVVFVTDRATVKKAGPDYQKTIELVQSGLTEAVMQELDARVDIDKETSEKVAGDYLSEEGYIGG
ncbi:MAG TPA: glycine betaine ABC transporter substrate-binding protein [Solirubrobacterales bacterium]|nr:glycine betaine ABC transporter substrate-binding protein [Solirubrobacterales bacterium]